MQGADQELDRALWAAIRLFEQRAHVSTTMQQQEKARGRARRAALHSEQAAEAHRHARMLRDLQLQRKKTISDEVESDVASSAPTRPQALRDA